MISIIICSRNNDIPMSLKDNIKETIGSEYELIVIDNSANEHSIFSAYNEGVSRSMGDILCFMHEDITFVTKDWGKNVYYHLKDSSIGLIGVFGGHYLPNAVCHIGDSELLSYHYYYVSQNNEEYFYSEKDFDANGEVEVVAVDGLWFAMPRMLFEKVSFDEKYRGFHYYDMDICLQVLASGYSCKVVDDVVMKHNSGGKINDDFIFNSYMFCQKWRPYLPLIKGINCDADVLKLAESLCQYKRYCRELELENAHLKGRKFFDLNLVKTIIRKLFVNRVVL